MNVLDLFSGIGGFSLGLERAGMRTVAFCEIEPFCRGALADEWPGVPCYPDIRELTAARLAADGISVDVICGGFPCQDISHAAGAKARGLEGDRSGLWFEMLRLVRELRPAWVLIENVPRLRTLGADRVLSDLEKAGYTARPHLVGAIHAGADHIRKRVWIIANANGMSVRDESGRWGWSCRQGSPQPEVACADADCEGEHHLPVNAEMVRGASVHGSAADAGGAQLALGQGERRDDATEQQAVERSSAFLRPWQVGPFEGDALADGIPADLDESDPALNAALKAYGNAVVPQLTYLLGRAIMSTYKAKHPAAFINALSEGPKSDVIVWLQKTWDELVDAKARIAVLESAQHAHDFQQIEEDPWHERCACGLMRDAVGRNTQR